VQTDKRISAGSYWAVSCHWMRFEGIFLTIWRALRKVTVPWSLNWQNPGHRIWRGWIYWWMEKAIDAFCRFSIGIR
jgi:hypothetical protein